MPGMPAMPPQFHAAAARRRNGPSRRRRHPARAARHRISGATEPRSSRDTQCTGQMEMSGHGEINFTSDDAYTGTITFTAEGMTMTVNLTGTKVDECDNPVG